MRKWEQDTELAIEAARKAKDIRRVWHLMRELGGTGIRARKRNLRDRKREDPTPQEWMGAMSKPGGEGGCRAELIKYLAPAEAADRKELIDIPLKAGAVMDTAPFQHGELLPTVQKMKYKRCVPRGRARKELYQMSMEWEPQMESFYTSFMNVSYVASRVLRTWELAEAAQLEKHDGKTGVAAVRFSIVLDPVSKA